MEKEDLEKIVKDSKTITEVIKKLGLRAAGGNFKSIKKRIEKYEIDVTHFESDKIRREKLGKYVQNYTKRPLAEYLTENSDFCRKNLKSRLYSEGIKQKKCELCGQDENWNGKKMSLILDHKNGIWNDNRIENLRIVCPNCNATLPTHCGRNKSKRNILKIKYGFSVEDKVDFRKIITPSKIESYLNRRVVNRPSYDILLQEVKDLGYSATGRKYGVSDNAIRKWVISYEKFETSRSN